MEIKNKLEAVLASKAGLPLLCLALIAVMLYLIKVSTPPQNNIVASSVMITNTTGNSGGTGIVLESSETSSKVLTNSHVCKVVEKGGLVTGWAGTFLVATYKHSQTHDLCLITVDGNLRANTYVATRAPTPYYEGALISGHPQLFPNTVTAGHFSGRKMIPVMKGIRPCTEDEKNNPDTALACAFAGGIPEITRYDAVLVTATIMPGSSGSGVYNADRELAGVAFAGSGGLGYAWTVPYESMVNFINIEARTLEALRPDNSVNIFASSGEKKSFDESESLRKLKQICSSSQKDNLKGICELIEQDIVWFK